MTVCDCCKCENVELRRNPWLKAELCDACLCEWYDGGHYSTWEELRVGSLKSGDRWFKDYKTPKEKQDD